MDVSTRYAKKFPLIPERSWVLPLPGRSSSQASSGSFDDTVAALEDFGFKRVLYTTSFRYTSFQFQSFDKTKDSLVDFGLWHHPAGVVVSMSSYTSGGYTDSYGDFVERKKTVSGMSANVELDTGAVRETNLKAAVGIQAGGTSDLMFDGTDRKISNKSLSSMNELMDYLRQCQTYGKLVPVNQWYDKNALYLAPELFLPLLDNPAGAPVKLEDLTVFLKKDLQKAHQKVVQEVAPELRTLMDPGHIYWLRLAKPKGPITQKPGMPWVPVEYTLQYFGEALEGQRIRWPKESDRTLLKHWANLCLPENEAPMDAWQWSARAPAGISLLNAMVHSAFHPPVMEKLETLIREAPRDDLVRWVSEPDAAGYTFFLHLCHMMCPERQTAQGVFGVDVALDLLNKVVLRVGWENVTRETATRSLTGFLFSMKDTSSPGKLAKGQSRLVAIIQSLQSNGIEWNTSARWVSKNSPISPERNLRKPPSFHEIEGPVTQEVLDRHLPVQNGLEGLRALLSANRLEAVLPNPSQKASFARLRM